MATSLPVLLEDYRRVLFVHAHPDDETLATGGLIAELVSSGVEVDLITCTRGEEGEIVPCALAPDTSPADLVLARAVELTAAVNALGIRSHGYLGTPPASADGLERTYADSGMVWISEGVAGPAPDTGEHAFSRQPIGRLVADLLAWIEATGPEVVLSYDAHGGYGHPDHVRAHDIARLAAEEAGLPLVEFVTSDEDAEEWVDVTAHHERVAVALDAHRSQLTREGDTIVHVGGQRHPMLTRVGLRRR